MRQVIFKPEECDTWPEPMQGTWKAWLGRSQTARDRLTEALAETAGAPVRLDLNQAIWQDLKDWLLTYVFDKKCAYCESRITDVSFGDGEHYRVVREECRFQPGAS